MFKRLAESIAQKAENRRIELEQRRAAKREVEEQQRLVRALQEERERKRLAEYRQLQSNTLTIVEDGKAPDMDWESEVGELPFRFMKSEHLLWVFPETRYLEQRTKREIVGRSAGTSIRIAKGVSVRAGASRGTPVESDVIVDRGMGMMAVTTKHIYFNGDRVFRIAFNKIVAIEPRGKDTVSVTRDRVSAHPEFFVVGTLDGKFAYELMQSVPSVEWGRKEPERLNPSTLMVLDGDGGYDLLEE